MQKAGLSINRNILECKGGCSWYVRKPVCVLIETYWNVKNNIRYSLKRRLSINRNILECKVEIIKRGGRDEECINRNILECKGRKLSAGYRGELGINRNILECKGKSETSHRFPSSVLIETYWNVKKYTPDPVREGYVVLIETYWNVKKRFS